MSFQEHIHIRRKTSAVLSKLERRLGRPVPLLVIGAIDDDDAAAVPPLRRSEWAVGGDSPVPTRLISPPLRWGLTSQPPDARRRSTSHQRVPVEDAHRLPRWPAETTDAQMHRLLETAASHPPLPVGSSRLPARAIDWCSTWVPCCALSIVVVVVVSSTPR